LLWCSTEVARLPERPGFLAAGRGVALARILGVAPIAPPEDRCIVMHNSGNGLRISPWCFNER
jgi:hypothetical protein